MKFKKIKNLILRKFLPCVCVIILLCSCFVIFPSAEAHITDDNHLFMTDRISDLFINTSTSSNSYIVLGANEGAYPDGNSPCFYYTGFERGMPTGYYRVSGLFDFEVASNVLVQFADEFLQDNNTYTFNFPLNFYQDPIYDNFLPNSIEFQLLDPNREVFETYTFLGVDDLATGVASKTYDIKFNIKGKVLYDKLAFVRIRLTLHHTQGNLEYLYGGLLKKDVITIRDENRIYDAIYNSDFGNSPNTYFDFENNILNSVDHTAVNSFFSNLSIFDNFGNGIYCVSRIFNEFINYNGSQWTWVYNLLSISLLIGMVAFTLGFSTSYFGRVLRSPKSDDRYKRTSLGFGADISRGRK